MELLTLLVETYEEKYFVIHAASPKDVLNELKLKQTIFGKKDLALLLGSESTVSEVLSGKRELNKHHIEKLSKRFGVSPEVFCNL
jgi:HTH-type transcriptional regulator / antitoxin HigA